MGAISGIYKISSKCKPERIYIGSAGYVQGRWGQHMRSLKLNKHHSIKLQRHYNKYGENDLVFEILTTCEKEELIEKEQYFIDVYNPYFNCSPIAGSRMGSKATPETRKRLSESHKGYIVSEETRKKLSEIGKGRKHTEESRRKMSISQTGHVTWITGKHHSEETKRRIGIKNKGKISPYKNIPRTEETKRRISRKRSGQKLSIEHREKLRKSHLGQIAWNKGKPHSEAHKQNLKKAWIKRKQLKEEKLKQT